MKIAIYSITRDRLAYTQACFESLRRNAGMPFDHYVFDNGSTDGTRGWLKEHHPSIAVILPGGRMVEIGNSIHLNHTNQGISKASNYCVRQILQHDYDLIIKADNDCFVRTPNILPQICDVMAEAGDRWILSPRVEGINRQPRRHSHTTIAGHPIGKTPIVGGLFHVVPAAAYRRYMDAGGFPEDLPPAKGQDDHFCHWWITTQRGQCGYIEDLVVEHYETTDGQARRYPEYFERKWREEKDTRER